VLYELLCERRPYDVSSVPMIEAARVIREKTPTRLSSVNRTLRGDVETITLKALEKDRDRRYQSAADLQRDIQRYLDNEAIEARRPSVGYQLSRFARRHRELVAATALVFVLLVASLAVTSVLLVRAKRAEKRTDGEAKAANEARAVAVQERQRADDALTRVLSLSDVKLVSEYIAEADGLWPAHPEKIAQIESWLDKAWALCERLPVHESALAALRQQAEPRTPAQAAAERATHRRLPELEAAQGRLGWLRRRLAICRGDEVDPVPAPDWESLPKEGPALNQIAWPLVDPDRISFGDEARALAIARRAAELAPDSAAILDTLAWALLANGLGAEAEETALRAVDAAPEDEREQYEASAQKVREAVAQYGGSEGLDRLRVQVAETQAQVHALDEEVSSRRSWRFADTSVQWQHDVLGELVEGLRAFGAPETGTVADVEARLTFARTIEQRTVTGPEVRTAWSAAIASIADRDACPLYEGLVITPQIGLIPLDRNPRTGLWEFWHVQTGARPEPNPAWPDDAPNRWLITGETGLVFVLIPGGTFRMGAERLGLAVDVEDTPEGPAVTAVTAGTLAERLGVRAGDVLRVVNGVSIESRAALGDALRTVTAGAVVAATVVRDGLELELTATAERGVDSPNVDPDAQIGESPVHEVTLDPFLLSKYEMTQGQWLRFTGENLSTYAAGQRFATWDITGANPVEQVSWEDVDRVVDRLGLVLPTEAQWEHACRAGTGSVWPTGNEPGTLQGYANIADEGVTGVVPASWTLEPGIDDGFAVHAPVGSFRPNRFGLHDAVGNVWEWCRDHYVGYGAVPRPGDGLREAPGVSWRVFRGGSFSPPAVFARSALRGNNTPLLRNHNLGLRPSRVITE
jgi:formylglycine-generating enzyme required for sulfatase activity